MLQKLPIFTVWPKHVYITIHISAPKVIQNMIIGRRQWSTVTITYNHPRPARESASPPIFFPPQPTSRGGMLCVSTAQPACSRLSTHDRLLTPVVSSCIHHRWWKGFYRYIQLLIVEMNMVMTDISRLHQDPEQVELSRWFAQFV